MPPTSDTSVPDVEENVPRPTSGTQPRSAVRKYILLVLFCFARFLDAFNISALYPSIPTIAEDLGLAAAETVWMVDAYTLTFASLLLVSGRISDVYNPKYTFISGAVGLGITCLACGFAKQKIALLVLRALSGIAASLTIPSALTLIVHLFPDPNEQAFALGAFSGTGAIANILGLILGAILVQYANWSFVFWFTSMIAIPIAVICVFMVPQPEPHPASEEGKPKSLDLIGVSLLTVACLLFIFAFTSASTAGWRSAEVIAPLIISIFIGVAFFVWEARIPERNAALPPRMWRYPNFGVLIGMALVPFLWYLTVFLLQTSLWQDVFGWSAIKTAVHFVPIGITGLPVTFFTGFFTRFGNPKWIMLFGAVLTMASTALLPFASSPDRYWRLDFPAFVVGTLGSCLAYVNMSVAIFRATPPEVAGTVGAVFTAALQLGAAVGSPVMSAIQESVEKQKPHDAYAGRAAAYWFLFACTVLQGIAVLVFYKHRPSPLSREEVDEHSEEKIESKDSSKDSSKDEVVPQSPQP